MDRRRGLFAVAVVFVVGVALIVTGEALYEAAAAQAARINGQCPNGEPCPTAMANPHLLGFVYLGAAIAVIAILLAIYVVGSTRGKRAAPG